MLLKQSIEKVLTQIKQQGATSAAVSGYTHENLSTTVRMGDVDTVEFNRAKHLSLTVYFGQKQGSATTSDLTDGALESTVNAACSIAKHTAEDPYAGLAEPKFMATNLPDLDLYHPWDISTEESIELTKQCEKIALSQDKKIINF